MSVESNCHKEPIHIPNNVQNFGYLIVLEQTSKRIQFYSKNIFEIFNISDDEELLGGNIEHFHDIFNPVLLSNVYYSIVQKKIEGYKNIEKIRIAEQEFYLIVYTFKGRIYIEIEKYIEDKNSKTVFKNYEDEILLNDVSNLWDSLVKNVYKVTGYDRIMVYQFLPNGTGTVIAEQKKRTLDSYLNLLYPESDIPRQARALYLINRNRILSNAFSSPVKIVGINEPLDMTYSTIRAMSPIHCEYTRNSGAASSFSVSIIIENQLWGLVICQNVTPKHINLESRKEAEILTLIASNAYMNYQYNQNKIQRQDLKNELRLLGSNFSKDKDFFEVLENEKEKIRTFVESDGCAIFIDGKIIKSGKTPSDEEILKLADWISVNVDEKTYINSEFLKLYGNQFNLNENTAGILLTFINKNSKDCVIWFKEEFRQNLNWAGNPEKKFFTDSNNVTMVSPRKSFEVFTEISQGTSKSWLKEDAEVSEKVADLLKNLLQENQVTKLENAHKQNLHEILDKMRQEMFHLQTELKAEEVIDRLKENYKY